MAQKQNKAEALQAQLLNACEKGLLAKVETLLKSGVDPSFAASTCLNVALNNRYERISHILLQHGARAFDVALKQCTCVLVANRYSAEDNYWKIKLLLAFMTKETVAHDALFPSIQHTATLRTLLRIGADPNRVVDKHARSPLAVALAENQVEAAHLLLDSGANPHFEYTYLALFRSLGSLTGQRITMLHLAASMPCHNSVLERLLKAGVAHSTTVYPPLIVALLEKARDNVRSLLAAGASSGPRNLMRDMTQSDEYYYAIKDAILHGAHELSPAEQDFLSSLRRKAWPDEQLLDRCPWTWLQPGAYPYSRVNRTALQAYLYLAPQKLM